MSNKETTETAETTETTETTEKKMIPDFVVVSFVPFVSVVSKKYY